MINQRGQAFDAFKLLIAAVVAGAILVILLGIINQISPQTEDPNQVIPQILTTVKSGGVQKLSERPVTFSRDESFEADAFAIAASMNKGSVVFCCGDGDPDTHCADFPFAIDDDGSDDPTFSCTADILSVNREISGKIMGYCPVDEEDPCVIGFKEAR